MCAFRLACLQTPGSPGDPEANLAELDRAAARSVAAGADLLVTPELFLTGYDIEGTAAFARQPLVSHAAEIARRNHIALLVGVPLRTAKGMINAAVFVDETGEVIGTHAKTHLFGELDRSRFVPGFSTTSIVDYRGLRIAILICYDVEFPETVRAAALHGAQLIAVPTAQMTPFAWVAETLIPVRAWENQVYLCYVNHSGAERDTVYVGRSSIVGPNGGILAQAHEEPALLLAEIDPREVEQGQRDNPYLADLRTDLHPQSAVDAG
ncbi:putative amidohydrolase [Tamaricihabitans halophyticus]|uniref:Putative amidohydrolase n=1 Tax=Tamaricihabitans halophyticus TaxID=1262583 RepID=A0A4R2QSA6_9PSEU|nr:carbon-nitrogen hydrolase family protein [Tamaricihabitans halophyticus]TCP49931.1 putative amidohydrolase [Tamaricihabitans halophyticus]